MSVYSISLFLHIASGMTALFTGLVAMTARKGGTIHRRAGLVFFYAMLLVSASALTIAVPKENLFLVFIAIFALYQNLSGYRAIHNKSRVPRWYDWLITAVGGINGILMLLTGNIVLMVFGGISALLASGDVYLYAKVVRGVTIGKKEWLRQHIGMMTGTYIATSTAFLVVNIKEFDPYWVPWLLPTAIGVPFLSYMSRKHAPRRPKVQQS
jgi:uncharacterized membrane protein